MSFVEEVKSTVSKRSGAEDTVKQAVRDCIMSYTKMVGWNRAYFNSTELKYLLLKNKSGWSTTESVNDLTHFEVVQALDFIITFLIKEGFQVEHTINSYGIDLIITWKDS